MNKNLDEVECIECGYQIILKCLRCDCFFIVLNGNPFWAVERKAFCPECGSQLTHVLNVNL